MQDSDSNFFSMFLLESFKCDGQCAVIMRCPLDLIFDNLNQRCEWSQPNRRLASLRIVENASLNQNEPMCNATTTATTTTTTTTANDTVVSITTTREPRTKSRKIKISSKPKNMTPKRDSLQQRKK